MDALQSELPDAKRRRLGASPEVHTPKRVLSPPRRSRVAESPPPPKRSPYFKAERPRACRRSSDAVERPTQAWVPPVSPYGLLQECLYEDPWRVLVACVLLNKTSAAAVRGVVFQLFALCPTAAACVATPHADIARLTNPLGLHKRAAHIKRLSEQYVAGGWRDVEELCGCGVYARDAFHLFVTGNWRDVQPRDKELVKYKQFLIDTDGLGHGLTRERVHEV